MLILVGAGGWTLCSMCTVFYVKNNNCEDFVQKKIHKNYKYGVIHVH